MLKIEVDKSGSYCPMAYCDYCDQRIETAHDGMYAFKSQDATQELKLLHKHQCFDAVKRGVERDGETLCWTPLEALFVYLAHNLKVDADDAERAARMFEAL